MPDVLKFVLNKDGVKELLQSQEMQDIIKQHASAKASQAGDGYAYSVKVGQTVPTLMYIRTPKRRQRTTSSTTRLKRSYDHD